MTLRTVHAGEPPSPGEANVVFRSKVDIWLGAVLAGTPVLAVSSVLASALTQPWPVLAPVIVLAALPVGLPLWLLRTTDYTLTAAELVIRCGPFRWRVPVAEIRSVQPTRDPLSSPALSLDRLRIDYGPGRSIMISPADRDSFLRELEIRRAAKDPPRRRTP